MRSDSAIRPTLTQRTYDDLRAAIIGGQFRPGTVLGEGRLAAELGVSKTPVRHALNLLRQDGFLVPGSRRQLVVADVSDETRSEVREVRAALETIAVRRASAVASLEEIDHLRLLLIRQRRAADAHAEDDFIELDEQLHLAFAAAARLAIVERMLTNLRGFVRLMRFGTVRSRDHLSEVWSEHEAIVDAIERRDADAAVAALLAHLERTDYVE
jgi:DNA-binding GntR family transcriptional regulator